MSAVSIIVAVYKNVPALELLLRALQHQSDQRFEVIITEDNDGAPMRECIAAARERCTFAITHLSQPDRGFRKDLALNRAIAASNTDYLVFIDGDCIPHRHFVKAHSTSRRKGFALYGRRVMLSERRTAQAYASLSAPDAARPHTFGIVELWRSGCTRLDCMWYLPFLPQTVTSKSMLIGCNWSIHKQHLIDVNGFDEDFITPGCGEDTEIEGRLLRAGVRLKKVKNHALQYHLHHPENYSDTVPSMQLMAAKRAAGAVFCANGLSQHLTA
jgi:glycosyltransferase involved in cell wall biosynthesis